MQHSSARHLPVSTEECRQRGWDYVDIVLVSGDAYVDHPSFGLALIGRLLESKGYRVAILPQPRHHIMDDFRRFGRPRLFFGISAGNLDSIVANYSANGKVRDHDAYSTDGKPWWPGEKSRKNRKRPDRATIVYANLARAAYRDVPIILGGVEASLRRFVHYDYKQQKLRGSVLTDAKADLLVYGMGEKTVLQLARMVAEGNHLTAIPGTCERMTDEQLSEFRQSLPADRKIQMLPSLAAIQEDNSRFLEAELTIDELARGKTSHLLAQRQQSSWIVQYPASQSITQEELDSFYHLPFSRTPHRTAGEIPAYTMIRHSVTTVRGCSGNCSFCAITRHQGPTPVSRSKKSIINEAKQICQMDDFTGTISDLGGPTANLYGTQCTIGGCKKHDCLFPEICKHLKIDEQAMLVLLDEVASLQKVKNVFVSSGLRMELLLKTPELMKKIITTHTPGSLKIAPEHTEDDVLRLMHKEPHKVLRSFVSECRKIELGTGKKVHLTPYIITGHPGSSSQCSRSMIAKLRQLGLTVRQFQDFTPTPGTLATAMFISGRDTAGKKIKIPTGGEKTSQRKIVEQAFFRKKRKK